MNKKGLSLFALTMIAIGSTIGSGIFKTPTNIAQAVPDPMWMTVLWIAGGVVSMIGALVYAEMGGRFPKGGGIYTYLKEAFGPLPAFLYGWCLLTVVSSGTIAALIVVFADYSQKIVGFSDQMIPVVAASSIVILTLFNMFSLDSSKWFANVSTVLKIVGIYGLLILLLFLGTNNIFDNSISVSEIFSNEKAQGFGWAKAFVGVLWSYSGWHYASFVTNEAENPKRNVPLALIIGTLVVTLSYILVSIGYMSVLSIEEIQNSKILAADALEKIIPGGSFAVSILIALSVFGCAGLYVLATPRIVQHMSNEGLFFEAFGKSHPKFGVPVNAILLQSAWAIVLIFVWGKFEALYTYVTITEWFFLALACSGIFVFRMKKMGQTDGIFKSPLYPVLPVLFIAVVAWFIVKNALSDDPAAYFGLMVIPVGAVVYYVYGKTKSK
jgi:APA family basic amino acid/polyamine antiporter